MRKYTYITFTACLMFCCAINMSSQDKKITIAGATYYSTGLFPSSDVGEISLGYDITKSVSLSLNGLASNLYASDKAWGASLNVSAYPKVSDKFVLIPSIGFGALGGMLKNKQYDIRASMNLAVEARYLLYNNFYCGFESKYFSAGKGMDTFLFGIKFILKL